MSERNQFEQEVVDELYYQRRLLLRILRKVGDLPPEREPQLSELRIFFKPGEAGMPPTVGPLNLTTAGQVATATVLGFDQKGNPMPADFKMPPITYSIDDKAGAVVKAVDNGDGTATLTAVGNGTANLTAKATSAEGLSLSDSEPINVSIGTPPPPPTPVLSSIKIGFSS